MRLRFLASALFLTGDVRLSKQVSHHALLTKTWWIINTSIQIPGETQMPGWDKARRDVRLPLEGFNVLTPGAGLGTHVRGAGN